MEVFQSEANSPVVRSGSEEATSSSSSGVSSAMSEILNVSVLGGFMGGESESLTMSARKQQGRLFSKVQLRELEARFDLSPHVEPEEIGQLAAVLELHPVQASNSAVVWSLNCFRVRALCKSTIMLKKINSMRERIFEKNN